MRDMINRAKEAVTAGTEQLRSRFDKETEKSEVPTRDSYDGPMTPNESTTESGRPGAEVPTMTKDKSLDDIIPPDLELKGLKGHVGPAATPVETVFVPESWQLFRNAHPSRAEDAFESYLKAATAGSAGIDLRIIGIEDQDGNLLPYGDGTFILEPNETVLVCSGLAVWLNNPAFAAFILPRSGLGSKHGIVLGNLVGLIDEDYQGELKMSLWNRGNEPFKLTYGERVAQYTTVLRANVSFNIVSAFSNATERGAGGFGSSGVK